MAYIEVPVESDPTDVAQEAFDYLQTTIPGWLPSPGNLEGWLVEALAQIASELRELLGLVPDSIFEFYGSSILGLPPQAATPATGSTTWTAIDAAGNYLVPAGTLIGITPTASQDVTAFQVVSDFAIPPGILSVSGIQVVAIEAGAAASGITGTVQPIDPLDFIAGVTLDGPTGGGQDAEDPDAYLARLSDLLTLMSPRPILPQDFAILAQRMVAGVARATAIDLYNPGPPIDTNCPRCVSVVLVDANGNPVTPTIKSEVDALLQSMREVNFLVFVLDPTYETIDVSFDVMAYPGYDPADVETRVVAQLQSYLSPASWGVPPFGDTGAQSWLNATAVRYLELAEQINRVDGVDYIKTLALGLHGGALGTADVALTGVAPLPNPGTISGTVEAP
jgi:hypothetical protein